MKAKLIPLVLALLGLAIGIGSAVFLRPPADHTDVAPATEQELIAETEFVKLNNQFVIPVVEEGRVVSLVILSLTLEVTLGSTESVYAREPKLRDGLLQVMFEHANFGGFKGVFTDGANLVMLREALLEAARKAGGEMVLDVLISDISRQDS